MLVKSKNNKSDQIRSFLRRELGKLAKDFTHIESYGEFYHAVLKNGQRVLLSVNQPPEQDLMAVGALLEIFRAQMPRAARWVAPVVLWRYTTPRLLAQSHSLAPTWADIAAKRHRGAVAKKYLLRYLAAWFIDQWCRGGHFFASPRLADFYLAPGNRVGASNFLNTGFLEPAERRVWAALLFTLLKGERALATKIILSRHYHAVHPHHTHKFGLHLSGRSANTVAGEVQTIFRQAQAGHIILSQPLAQAAQSLADLEKLALAFDKEATLDDNLLSALIVQLPAVFKLKKEATPQAVASVVMN